MKAIRTITWAVTLGCVMAGLGPEQATAQSAGSKAAVLSQCEALMKDEFGEAEFAFSKIRRAEGNKQYAFGELTLKDGTKRRVRCAVARGQVQGVEFRTGNTSTRGDGAFWSNDRPPGAEFVPPKPEETEENVETVTTTSTSAEVADAPAEDTQDQADATSTEPQDPEAEEQADQPQDDTANTTETDDTTTTSAEQATTEDKDDDDPANFTPVFRRVN